MVSMTYIVTHLVQIRLYNPGKHASDTNNKGRAKINLAGKAFMGMGNFAFIDALDLTDNAASAEQHEWKWAKQEEVLASQLMDNVQLGTLEVDLPLSNENILFVAALR